MKWNEEERERKCLPELEKKEREVHQKKNGRMRKERREKVLLGFGEKESEMGHTPKRSIKD